MTRAEQHRMIETLREYENKMKGRDRDDFDMLRKRDRDDEELDRIAVRRLMELTELYVPERFR